MDSELTYIRVTKTTRARIAALGGKTDTYETILCRLLDEQEKKL